MSDRRSHFANDFVAHRSVTGPLGSARVVDGAACRVAVPVANIYKTPEFGGLERQSVLGQPVTVLEERDGWAFMRDDTKGFVGYMAASDLEPWIAPTHRVIAPRSLVFSRPDIKTPDPIHISMGSLLAVDDIEGRFAKTRDGSYAIASHLTPIAPASDPVAVAERLVGTPYLWGGNSGFGIDCSGVVQAGLSACHIDCPGDSDQQEAQLGQTVTDGSIRRGDLFFWKGHVAMAMDADRLIHATAHYMAVVIEPIADTIARIEQQGGGPVTRQVRVG